MGTLPLTATIIRTCPYCEDQKVYRQRARGIIERYLIRAFRFVPYWCAGCDRRFYVRLHRPR
jgi:hypothetical protein